MHRRPNRKCAASLIIMLANNVVRYEETKTPLCFSMLVERVVLVNTDKYGCGRLDEECGDVKSEEKQVFVSCFELPLLGVLAVLVLLCVEIISSARSFLSLCIHN